MANSLVKKLIRVQNKTTEWQSSRLTWIKGRTTTLMHMDYNASFVPPHLKETNMRVLDIVLLKLLFYGTFCRVGLVALNRKLGFPSREIDIQWKKGKMQSVYVVFYQKTSIYHYLFQWRNKVVKVLIMSSATFREKLEYLYENFNDTHVRCIPMFTIFAFLCA